MSWHLQLLCERQWVLFTFTFVFLITPHPMSLWLYDQCTSNYNYYGMVKETVTTLIYFLHHTLSNVSVALCPRHLQLLCHGLWIFFKSRYLFLITPSLVLLKIYVQNTCNYYVILNETVSTLCFFFNHTMPNVSGAIYPRHLQLLPHS